MGHDGRATLGSLRSFRQENDRAHSLDTGLECDPRALASVEVPVVSVGLDAQDRALDAQEAALVRPLEGLANGDARPVSIAQEREDLPGVLAGRRVQGVSGVKSASGGLLLARRLL